jgi:hypothetical protein
MRRIVVSLSSIVALAVAYLTAVPAAFAMTLTPPSGGDASLTASNVAHHAGLASWEISLIVTGAVLLTTTLLTTAIRAYRRSVPTPCLDTWLKRVDVSPHRRYTRTYVR